MEPVKRGVGDAYGGESMEEDGVRNSVEGRTQIEEDEDGDQTGVSCNEEVVGDLDEGRFCAMEGTETRLELFIKAVMGEMGVELRGDSFFEDFGDEGEVRNGAEVIEIVGV